MFINRYADYASKLLPVSRELHELVALQLVGSAFGGDDVALDSGPVNIWVLLTGNPDSAKPVAKVALPILEAARLTKLLRTNEWDNMQALDQDIAGNPGGLCVWGELSQRLKCEGLQPWLIARYESFGIPKTNEHGYHRELSGMNILATCSPSWFLENFDLPSDYWSDCFLARWQLLPGISGDVPEPGTPDEGEAKALGTELRRISFVSGDGDTSAVDQYDWRRAAEERFRARGALPFFSYHCQTTRKLAVLYEAATSYNVKVTKESWDRAAAMASRMEETLFALLDSAPQIQAESRIEERIRTAGADGLRQSAFTRTFQRVEDCRAQLQTLIDAGRVRVENRSTAGRPAKFLVHVDFWDQDDTSFTISRVP